jgi:hypothetical protein
LGTDRRDRRIVFVVLQMASQALIQAGGTEPPFGAPAEAIVAFFMAKDGQLFALGEYLSTISLIVFLWFLGSLWPTCATGLPSQFAKASKAQPGIHSKRPCKQALTNMPSS